MKVSVLLICYNQENYIRQSLESILSQETNFKWELLIGEDASPDNTADVIRQIISSPPANCTVRPFLRETNMGASKNLFDLIKQAKGDYLTVLEGDDYWLDTKRLQTLADYLDEHPDLVGVSHRRERRLDDKLIQHDPDDTLVGKRFCLKEYNDGKRFSAMACMFRNIYADDHNGYEYLFTGARNACDQIMCYSLLFAGDIFILDKTFGVYRMFSGGYCSQMTAIRRANDYLIQNRRLLERYGETPAISREIVTLHADIVKAYLREKQLKQAAAYYRTIPTAEKHGVFSAVCRSLLNKLRKKR